MSEKADSKLGIEVNQYLDSLGLNTPMTQDWDDPAASQASDAEKIEKITPLFAEIMEILGLDLSDDSLVETPKRVAKMYVKEIFSGLKADTFPKATTVENKMGYNDLVVERVTSMSSCEHHFVYFGTGHSKDLGVWIAYIPKDKVLGLSKLNRICEYFSRRPQIQERLTAQIAAALQYILGTDDVAVVMKAQHFCVLTRGVEDANSYTTTSNLHGRFMAEPSLRQELMAIVNSK